MNRKIQIGKYNAGNTPRKIQLGNDNSTNWKITIGRIKLGKIQTGKTVRADTNRQMQIEKTKNVGKYTSAKVSRGNSSRRIQNKEKIAKYRSGNTGQKTTIQNIQIVKYKSKKEIQIWKY